MKKIKGGAEKCRKDELLSYLLLEMTKIKES